MTISTETADLCVVDTNVLVYALDNESEFHSKARIVLDRGLEDNAGLCLTPQTLAELFAVVTNSRRVRSPMRPLEALSTIGHILSLPGVVLLPVPSDIVPRWLRLVERYPVTGSGIFDLQLVATMLGNGVRRVYTFNRSDFERIEEIEVLSP
ncbi:MAG: PIN domain-containing protein [Phycisphaerae bacterium]|nr:PIN domain-containing protein [Phycisphaerae bacterium]